MRENNIIKSISFNKTNPDDVRMLKYLKRKKNFSGFMKKILMEKITVEELKRATIDPEKEEIFGSNTPTQEVQLSAAERMKQIKEQIKKADNKASQ